MGIREFWVVLLLASASGCVGAAEGFDCMGKTRIAAGTNEPTFIERFSAPLVLPLSQTEFLRTLDGLGLRYSRIGGKGELPLTAPRHCPSAIDMSKIDHGYMIYAGHDPATERNEQYIAFVDRDLQVVYIENRYQYAPVVR